MNMHRLTQTQPDLFDAKPRVVKSHHSEGQERKRNGQFANLISKATWHSDALDMLRRWLKTKYRGNQSAPGDASAWFTMEDFKGFALAQGLEPPRHPNCWGTLTTGAARMGLIEWTYCFDVAKSPSAHARAIKLWQKGPNA